MYRASIVESKVIGKHGWSRKNHRKARRSGYHVCLEWFKKQCAFEMFLRVRDFAHLHHVIGANQNRILEWCVGLRNQTWDLYGNWNWEWHSTVDRFPICCPILTNWKASRLSAAVTLSFALRSSFPQRSRTHSPNFIRFKFKKLFFNK